MLKNIFYVALFTVVSWGSYQLSYPSQTPPDLFYDGVFFENVIKHVDALTQGPRAVGDYFHDDAQRYIIRQLNGMGLQVVKQKTTGYSPKNRTAAPVRNIIATYPGTDPGGPALLLLSHYDAAKFSGQGAADDASGVAVVLEAVNALLKRPDKPRNDMILLFTDAEELGLLGARAFIAEQLQHFDIGLVINLEARGSSGPSMMWPETVGGNRHMIEAFAAAEVPLPVTTSLHYEIYQQLPNDTDLTPFNQIGQINGFNLAFIDDHFNYHTRLDTLNNLSINTLAHQMFQINSMLQYFVAADLTQLHSDESLVYFTLPQLGLISHAIWVNWLLLGLCLLLLLSTTVAAFKHQQLTFTKLLSGSIPLLAASILAYSSCQLLLWLIDWWQPAQQDILQGFPYQGHHIMLALLSSSAIISMGVYGWHKGKHALSLSIPPLLLWLLILTPLVLMMPGSGLLLWPVLLSALLLLAQFKAPKLAEQLAPVLALLSFVFLGVILVNLPIALGMAALPLTAVLITWLLALFSPGIAAVEKKWPVLALCLLPLLYLIWVLAKHQAFTAQQPHPTSLSYLYDVDQQQGYFFNYDVVNTGWNDALFVTAASADERQSFRSRYRKPLKQLTQVDSPVPLRPIEVQVTQPLNQGSRGHLKLDIELQTHNHTEVLEIYTKQDLTVHKMSIEGRVVIEEQALSLSAGARLLQYYFNDKKNIELQIEIDQGQTLDWQIQSHALDLLAHPKLDIPARPEHQIPKPFIKSDNTIVVQSVTFGLDQ